jgi:hypothetical protein
MIEDPEEIRQQIFIAHHKSPPIELASSLDSVVQKTLRTSDSAVSHEGFDLFTNRSHFQIEADAWSEVAVLLEVLYAPHQPERIGLMHYRRFLAPHLNPTVFKRVYVKPDAASKILESLVEASDDLPRTVFVPKPLRVKSLEGQFLRFHPEYGDLFLKVAKIFIRNLERSLGVVIFRPLRSRSFTPWNMFHGPREFATRYSELIKETFLEADLGSYVAPMDSKDQRWAGFICERLFSIYVETIELHGLWPVERVPMATTQARGLEQVLGSGLELLRLR